MTNDTVPDMDDPEIRKIVYAINSMHFNVMAQVMDIRARVKAGTLTKEAAASETQQILVQNAKEQHERFGEALRKLNVDMPIIG